MTWVARESIFLASILLLFSRTDSWDWISTWLDPGRCFWRYRCKVPSWAYSNINIQGSENIEHICRCKTPNQFFYALYHWFVNIFSTKTSLPRYVKWRFLYSYISTLYNVYLNLLNSNQSCINTCRFLNLHRTFRKRKNGYHAIEKMLSYRRKVY